MHVKKGGYAGRTRPGFNGSDHLRFGDIQREMNLARKQKNQGSKRKPFLVRSRLYCRGRLTLFAFDASLLSAMLRNMLLATAEEANAAAAATVSGLCWAGWLAVGIIKTLSPRSLQYISSYTLDYNASLDLCTVLS